MNVEAESRPSGLNIPAIQLRHEVSKVGLQMQGVIFDRAARVRNAAGLLFVSTVTEIGMLVSEVSGVDDLTHGRIVEGSTKLLASGLLVIPAIVSNAATNAALSVEPKGKTNVLKE